MAHESRGAYFPYLKEMLGKDVTFLVDVEGENSLGVWKNCKRAWEAHDPEADWHVVIQDDAVVCDFFEDTAKRVIAFVEASENPLAISFYHGKRFNLKEEVKRCLKDGYIVSEYLSWGLAVCLPTKLIPEMIEWCDKLNLKQDYARINLFLRERGIPVFYPFPPIVEHRKGKSLVGDLVEERQA